MKFITTVLNTPWILVGLALGTVSIPRSLKFDKNNYAIIFNVKKLWWRSSNVRAVHIGQVVILSDKIKAYDLEHELVHVKQALREPLLHPVLYTIENIRNGYENNKYEIEAYSLSKSIFVKD